MRDVRINPGEFLPGPGRTKKSDEELRKACREFESVLTHELLKSMRRTVQKSGLIHGGKGEEIYESLLDQELAKNMAGIGPRSLAETLYRQLKKDGRMIQQGDAPSKWLGEDEGLAPLSPLEMGQPSSPFGWRKDPFGEGEQFHHGMDFAAPEGSPVRAPVAGRVLTSEFKGTYGNLVMLDHGGGLTTLYAHNKENRVKEGDWVKRGEVLATVGSTGRSTGPHLHFEVRRNGRPQDPGAFLSSARGGIDTGG